MRQLITGMVAAFAVVTASAAPAMACGLFDSCSPCTPCAAPQVYVPPPPPVYSGCNPCGGAYERLPDPEAQYYSAPETHRYYYVNQGPSYTGPGDLAPYPTYREGGYSDWHAYRHHHHYGYRPWHTHAYRYGYEHHMRYGYAMPHHYGYREHTLRRYY
jgi:hypothetical protein